MKLHMTEVSFVHLSKCLSHKQAKGSFHSIKTLDKSHCNCLAISYKILEYTKIKCTILSLYDLLCTLN